MKHGDMQSRNQGFALVLSLLILVIMMVLGVAALNSTIMQERMAGNARTQADVFNTSSEGVTRALELFYENADAFTFGDYNLSCGQVFGTTLCADPSSPTPGCMTAEAWNYPQAVGEWHLASEPGDNPRLEQRMYCCRSWEEAPDGDGGMVWIEHTSKLYALNRATFLGGADNTESLALREVEVEMAEAEPDDPTCAICIPGNMGNVDGPNSGSLNVSGNCGAAVVTDQATDPDAAATFIAGIGHASIGNFDGGVVGANMTPPWDLPAALAEFVFWVKLGLQPGSSAGDAGVGDSNVLSLYIDGDHNATGGSTTYGTLANPQITYIDGHGEFGGNVSGNGIIITRGEMRWNGTPDFSGLLISLGGGYIVSGGGKGGGTGGGSMVFTDLDYINVDPDDPDHLFSWEVLRYEVARDDDAQEVVMYYPDDFSGGHEVRRAQPGGGIAGSEISQRHVPVRPVLLTDDDTRLIHFRDPDTLDHRFFYYDAGAGHAKGDEFDGTVELNLVDNFVFLDSAGTPVMTMSQSVDPTRDAFGRLIPDYVLEPNYPEAYGYDPNRWNWDPALANAQFAWGSTNFQWSGAGTQNFSYDCRALQRIKHRLLCAQELQPLPADPQHAFYEDPESHYGDYCGHSVAGVDGGTGGEVDGKYHESYATPPTTGRPENQKAWHVWSPSCDCLGITVDADMIVTGWRENLGWRDDEEFVGCTGLPSPGG